jgi:hypothetical protein
MLFGIVRLSCVTRIRPSGRRVAVRFRERSGVLALRGMLHDLDPNRAPRPHAPPSVKAPNREISRRSAQPIDSKRQEFSKPGSSLFTIQSLEIADDLLRPRAMARDALSFFKNRETSPFVSAQVPDSTRQDFQNPGQNCRFLSNRNGAGAGKFRSRSRQGA